MAVLTMQVKIELDQWVSYLRNGLQTCYYCVAPMGFPEELQRKCIGHVRLPAPAELTGSGPAGSGAAGDAGEAGAADLSKRVRGEDREDEDDDHAKEEAKVDGLDVDVSEQDREHDQEQRDERERREPEQEPEGHGHEERRDMTVRDREATGYHKTNEEKWEEGLERKLAPLLGEVDIAEYYGKNIEE